MVLNVEIYGFMTTIFAPDRKNGSCQEMGGQYLKWCAMGISEFWILDTGYELRVSGCGFRVAGFGLQGVGYEP